MHEGISTYQQRKSKHASHCRSKFCASGGGPYNAILRPGPRRRALNFHRFESSEDYAKSNRQKFCLTWPDGWSSASSLGYLCLGVLSSSMPDWPRLQGSWTYWDESLPHTMRKTIVHDSHTVCASNSYASNRVERGGHCNQAYSGK